MSSWAYNIIKFYVNFVCREKNYYLYLIFIMKYLKIVAALVSSVVSQNPVFDANINQNDYYNILTMDGGGIRGLIPAIVVKHMEEYAYTYAKSKNYVVP